MKKIEVRIFKNIKMRSYNRYHYIGEDLLYGKHVVQSQKIKSWLQENLDKNRYERKSQHGRKAHESIYEIIFKDISDLNLFRLMFADEYKIEVQ